MIVDFFICPCGMDDIFYDNNNDNRRIAELEIQIENLTNFNVDDEKKWELFSDDMPIYLGETLNIHDALRNTIKDIKGIKSDMKKIKRTQYFLLLSFKHIHEHLLAHDENYKKRTDQLK